MRTHILLITVLFSTFSSDANAAFWSGPSRRFIFLNGGYTTTTNYQAHEEDILAFDRELFQEKTVILNAGGGKDMKVVKIEPNGQIGRDAAGSVLLIPSQYSGHLEANRINLQKEIMKAAKDKAKGISLVYGDHGGPRGLSLWDNNALSAEDLRAIYAKVPEKTVIRAVHLHCYAGNALVPPSREVPKNLTVLHKFVNDHYPKNRCAWALSSEDEVGQYMNWTNRWPAKSYWSPFFKDKPNPTLDDFNQLVEKDPSISSTPMSTTDYFVQDVAKFICYRAKEPSPGNPCPTCADGKSDADGSQLDDVMNVLEKDLCTAPVMEEQAKIAEETRIASSMESEYNTLKYEFAYDWIWDHDIEVYLERKAAVRMLDELYAKHAAAGTMPPEDEIRKIKGDNWIERFDKMRAPLTMDDNPDLRKFLATVDQAWLDKKAADYPTLSKHLSELGTLRGPGLTGFSAAILKYRGGKQVQRKKASQAAKMHRRKLVETWLEKSDVPELRKRYENLRNCETSSLN